MTAPKPPRRRWSRRGRGRSGAGSNTFDRMKERVTHAEAVSQAWAEMTSDDVEDRFAALEKEKEVDRLLEELKSRKLIGA